MNKRKAILFALLAVSAFLFVGCDNILEFLYPEFSESADGTGKVIVTIGFDSTIENYANRVFANGTRPIVVGFVPFQQTGSGYNPIDWAIQRQNGYFNDFLYDPGSGKKLKTFEFSVTTNANYKVIAWLDVDGNDDPTHPDSGSTTIEPGTIVYTNSGDYYVDLRWHSPSDPNIYMGTNLTSNSTVNWDQFTSDPTASGGTGGVAPYAPTIAAPYNQLQSGASITMYGYDNGDPDGGWIVNREWTIEVPGSAPETRQGFIELPWTFYNNTSTQITAYVSLKVQDNNGNWSETTTIQLTVYAQDSTISQVPFAVINQGAGLTVTTGDWVWLEATNSYDYDGWIANYEWIVGPDVVSSSYYLSQQFFNPNTDGSTEVYIPVYLRVQDNNGNWSTQVQTTITVMQSGYNQPPYVEFDSNRGYSVGIDTWVDFTNNSYDYDTGIEKIEWMVYSPYDGWYSRGGANSISVNFNYAGTWVIHLDVYENGNGTPYSLDRNVIVSEGGAYGSQANPFVISYGMQQDGSLDGNRYAYYKLTGLPGGMANQYARILVPSVDIDLYVYSDPGFTMSIGSSTAGGTTEESVNISGYSGDLYLKVYNYSSMPGTYKIWGEVFYN